MANSLLQNSQRLKNIFWWEKRHGLQKKQGRKSKILN